ncbi:MAG: hypothetical protein OXT49_04900, partial [Gammaproteobacteria bacterium]|nr:hypothetical protein [Gammaproteobacteria bacterium]
METLATWTLGCLFVVVAATTLVSGVAYAEDEFDFLFSEEPAQTESVEADDADFQVDDTAGVEEQEDSEPQQEEAAAVLVTQPKPSKRPG